MGVKGICLGQIHKHTANWTLHKVFPLSHNRVTLHIMKQLSLNINIKQLRPGSRLILCLSQKKQEQYFTFGFGKQERAFEGYFEKKIFPENPSLTSPSLDRVVRTSQGALTTLYRGFLLYCIYCLIFAQIDKYNFQITKYICPKYKLYLPKLPMYLSKYPNIFVQITSQRGTTIPLHGISLLFPSYFSFTNCNYNLLSISLQNLFWTCFPKWWQSLFFKLKFAIQFEFAKLHRYQKVLFIEKKSLFQFRWGCDNPFVHNLGFHDYTSVWSHEVAVLRFSYLSRLVEERPWPPPCPPNTSFRFFIFIFLSHLEKVKGFCKIRHSIIRRNKKVQNTNKTSTNSSSPLFRRNNTQTRLLSIRQQFPCLKI